MKLAVTQTSYNEKKNISQTGTKNSRKDKQQQQQ